MTTRFPLTTPDTAESFIRTPCSRNSCVGWIKVRWVYWFFIKPISFGKPDSSANPMAALSDELGTPTTISASCLNSRAN